MMFKIIGDIIGPPQITNIQYRAFLSMSQV
jgi:hypothetical protein